jgi:hypothetical protein
VELSCYNAVAGNSASANDKENYMGYFTLTLLAADKILARCIGHSGATVGLVGTEHGIFTHRFLTTPELKYVVGGIVDSVKLRIQYDSDNPQRLHAELVSFVELHWQQLNNETTLLGLWLDNGYIHFDLVENYRLQNAAERAGVARGELAIYDAANDRSVYLCNGGAVV